MYLSQEAEKKNHGNHHFHFKKRSGAISNPMMSVILTGLVIVTLLFASGLVKYTGTGFSFANVAQPGTGNTAILYCVNNVAAPSGYQCGASLGLTCSAQDPLLGSGINSGTCALFNGVTQIDSATTGAAGTGSVAASTYATGQQLLIKFSATNYVTAFEPVTIPPIPTSAAPASTVTVPVYDIKKGAWSFTMIGTGATTFSTGQTYIWASTGLTSINLAVTLTETTSNAGWKSTYDIVNAQMNDLVIEISDGGGAASNTQYLSIQGAQFTRQVGLTTFWLMQMPDGLAPQVTGPSQSIWPQDSLGRYALGGTIVSNTQTFGPLGGLTGASTLQVVGTQNIGGTTSFNLNIQKNNLATGNTITLSFKVWTLYDPNLFMRIGAGSQVTSQPNQEGSTFTIKFTG